MRSTIRCSTLLMASIVGIAAWTAPVLSQQARFLPGVSLPPVPPGRPPSMRFPPGTFLTHIALNGNPSVGMVNPRNGVPFFMSGVSAPGAASFVGSVGTTPALTSNPFAMGLASPMLFGPGMNTMYSNPYAGMAMPNAMYSYPMNAGAPYSTPMTGQDYGRSTQGNGENAALNKLVVEQALEMKDISRTLKAIGVQADGGQLSWPLGLQVLYPTTENDALRQQLDAVFQTVARQSDKGQVNPELVKEASHNVEKLRVQLRNRAAFLYAGTYKEAAQFLDQLDRSLTLLQTPSAQTGKKSY